MVRILEEFPQVRQTFNLVPSMIAQVAEYASGRRARPVPRAGPQARREPHRGRARLPAAALLLLRSAPHDLPLSALRRAVRRLAGAEAIRRAATVRRRRNSATCRCGRSSPGSTRSSRPTTPRCASGSQRGRNFTPGRPAPHGREAARDRGPGAAGIPASWPPPARSRSPPRLTTIPSCRCCAIRISPACRIPACRCRRASGIPQDARRQLALAREYVARALRRGAGGAVALGGLRFRRSLHASPRSWASSGPPPIAACSTARWAAPVPVEGLYRPYRWQQDGRSHAA